MVGLIRINPVDLLERKLLGNVQAPHIRKVVRPIQSRSR
jgi:hypothetical protein